ncbi:LacI family DNA-binding transcriptional regulator [Lentilactobacillus kisonensis]|nr:LacI family DNA-binding transcriptional regulator [Lentilactobacillus kisonensis]
MINIRQLAKLAQVSPGVVSRVLSEDPTLSISAETRQRVLDMIKKI